MFLIAPHLRSCIRATTHKSLLNTETSSFPYRIHGVCSFSIASTKSTDTSKRVIETPIVQECGSKWRKLVGRGSAMQMYTSLLFCGNMVLKADPTANIYEVMAHAGLLASASATVFFGVKLMCDKIITDVDSYREVGSKDEFVRFSIMGVVSQYALLVPPSDIKLLEHDGKDFYAIQVGARKLSLDTSTGKCLNRNALEILFQGKPIVSRRKTKIGKKASRRT